MKIFRANNDISSKLTLITFSLLWRWALLPNSSWPRQWTASFPTPGSSSHKCTFKGWAYIVSGGRSAHPHGFLHITPANARADVPSLRAEPAEQAVGVVTCCWVCALESVAPSLLFLYYVSLLFLIALSPRLWVWKPFPEIRQKDSLCFHMQAIPEMPLLSYRFGWHFPGRFWM